MFILHTDIGLQQFQLAAILTKIHYSFYYGRPM